MKETLHKPKILFGDVVEPLERAKMQTAYCLGIKMKESKYKGASQNF